MIVLLFWLGVLATELYLIYYLLTYRPYMQVDSWGEPDAGEACGWSCIILMALLAMLVCLILTLMAIVMVLSPLPIAIPLEGVVI